MRRLIPAGLARLHDWQVRFRAVGLTRAPAWKAAMSPSMRHALVASRIEHLPRVLRSGLSYVVDAGANEGQWILALRQFVAIKGVEAFEPNPEAFEILRRRLEAGPDVRLHNVALGDQSEVRTLRLTRSSELASLLSPSERLRAEYSASAALAVGEIEVPVTTLDAVIPANVRVDLLKVDVQGFEQRVLRGARRTLGQTRTVLIELDFVSHYEGDDTLGSVHEYLTRESGFEFWDMCGPHRGSEGRALWADAVFVNLALTSGREWRVR